jgi:hypothetical protein
MASGGACRYDRVIACMISRPDPLMTWNSNGL